MNKRDFERLLRNEEKLKELKCQIDDMAYKSVVGSQQLTGMPFVTGTSDKVGDYATRLTELEDKYFSLLIRQEKLRKRAKAFIREVPDETISIILYAKYIQGKEILDIADMVDIKGNYRESMIKKILNAFFLDCLLYM